MSIIFFGLGSIGLQHAKILLKKYPYKLYAFRSGISEKKNSLGIEELYSWEKVFKLKPDIAFITNPTYLHLETAIKCAEIGCKLFIEKPIDKDLKNLNKLLKLIKKKNLVTYLAYPLRFNPVIQKIKEYVKADKPLYIRAICSSFLPNWHLNRDHLKSYSARTILGGGVILDLSHEIDYICYLLGEIENIRGKYAKLGKVTIDAEDYADLLIDTKICPVNIHLDFLSHLRQRYIQVDFDGLTVIGDITCGEIKEYEKETLKRVYKLNYRNGEELETQLKYFFNNLDNPNMMNNLVDASKLYKKIILFKNG